MIYETILGPIRSICEEIKFFLERTPPQIYQNIQEQGIFLAGGTARIPDMDWFLSQATGEKVRLSGYYELCTIYGLKENYWKPYPAKMGQVAGKEKLRF